MLPRFANSRLACNGKFVIAIERKQKATLLAQLECMTFFFSPFANYHRYRDRIEFVGETRWNKQCKQWNDSNLLIGITHALCEENDSSPHENESNSNEREKKSHFLSFSNDWTFRTSHHLNCGYKYDCSTNLYVKRCSELSFFFCLGSGTDFFPCSMCTFFPFFFVCWFIRLLICLFLSTLIATNYCLQTFSAGFSLFSPAIFYRVSFFSQNNEKTNNDNKKTMKTVKKSDAKTKKKQRKLGRIHKSDEGIRILYRGLSWI